MATCQNLLQFTTWAKQKKTRAVFPSCTAFASSHVIFIAFPCINCRRCPLCFHGFDVGLASISCGRRQGNGAVFIDDIGVCVVFCDDALAKICRILFTIFALPYLAVSIMEIVKEDHCLQTLIGRAKLHL